MKKESVDSKSDILFALSHEIKNALTIISAMCSMAGANIEDRERVTFYLDRICNITERITVILDKSVDISKIKQGEECLSEKTFKLNELIEEVYQLLFPLASSKDVDFKAVYQNVINGEIIGDYSRLMQILINLATNSIKYTPSGGAVEISLEEVQVDDSSTADCCFICRDNGIGMSEDFLAHIFEPFARSDDERVRNSSGAGLGMSIVKETVDAMGGSIHINSNINAGTTVTVRLKLRKNMRKG